ncbi:MMPL family transporter [Oerskovia enterophila]|uniref:Membrane protein YdfJ n=1 Tax=Oerskovia enterophila TaxID=43678 RepID=A0ABX2YDG4_9CELL|nr:MMPL family transporter [Oerskovia enterophila]OCI31980.1 membrane protein YdfJ [Oerskovia enterophila]
MFESLGRAVAHRPRLTVAVWVVLTVLGFALAVVGVHGESLFDRLTTGEPAVPGSQSERGTQILTDQDTTGEEISLLVSGADPADPAVAEAMDPVHQQLDAITGVATVVDPFVIPGGVETEAAQSLVAADGDGFLVSVTLEAGLDEQTTAVAASDVVERLEAVPADLAEAAPGATGLVSSNDLIVEAITSQVEKDLTTGEMIALPIALLVMVLVFGGFLAAAMPMAGAIASIGAGLGVLLALSYPLTIDASVVNVVTLLGLGLSIDYGLLIVSRFREELHRLVDERDPSPAGTPDPAARTEVTTAVVRTMATAGRTVAFSALTVAISIAGLMVFEPDILRAIGAAGLAIILIAVATAMTLVPALLALAGHRLVAPSVLSRVPGLRAVLARTADVQSDEGVFSRLTGRVQRHPVWVMLGTVAVLIVLALPVLGLQMRNSGIELLPQSSPQREFVDEVTAQFPASEAPDLRVVTDSTPEQAQAWAEEIAGLEHVERVDPAVAVGTDHAVVGVHVDTDDAGGPEAVAVVDEVRALDPGFDFYVTGQAAGQVDFRAALADRVWWAVGIVVVATFVLLFLMTGSVLIPVKALLTNALSLAASLGVLVWVFQEGHLEGVLDFSSAGGIETYVVALVIAFAFGLAMDYEVFLLSRIKELHDAGLSNDEAVRLGLQRSGRIITSAAAIIIVVFAGFVFGELLVIKEVGFALAVAVFIDATIVRILLVPATMTLLGRANWWAPKHLRWLYSRFSITH